MPLEDPWLPANGAIAHAGITVKVFRYDPDAVEKEPGRTDNKEEDPLAGMEEMPNLAVLMITEQLGEQPSRAVLRYRFGTAAMPGLDPVHAEDAVSDQVETRRTLKEGDRIVVAAGLPAGGWEYLFDGFALRFELDLAGDGVTVLCLGVAARCWDEVIHGADWRASSDPADPKKTTTTQLSPIFNANGKPNRAPEGRLDPEGNNFAWHAFLDPDCTRATPASWELTHAAEYVIYRHNHAEDWVKNPLTAELLDVLVAKVPKADKAFDPADPDTYDAKPIRVPNKPIGGKAWPVALRELIEVHGIAMAWRLEREDAQGDPVSGPGSTVSRPPQTRLELFEPQGGPIKDLWLQQRGTPLDLTLTNTAEATVARDVTEVVTNWKVEGALEEYEVSFILALGFPTVAGDATTIATFDLGGAGGDKYRLFIADESGEGHYPVAPTAGAVSYVPCSLDSVLGAPYPDIRGGTIARYAARRRRPKGDLFSALGRRATLEISKDYAGGAPAVWGTQGNDGGTWQQVKGGWELLQDRIGIRLTCKNPNAWDIGTKGDVDASGVIRLIEGLAAPSAQNPRFWLRLTCVIEGDERLVGSGGYTTGPLGSRTVSRRVDAHERYRRQTVVKSAFTGAKTVVRDDFDAATAEAQAIALTTFHGVLEGPVTIPRLTRYYQVGDRIRSINGRGVGFRTDSPEEDGAPWYPMVEAITWDFRQGQATHLRLSDAGAARRSYARKIGGWR